MNYTWLLQFGNCFCIYSEEINKKGNKGEIIPGHLFPSIRLTKIDRDELSYSGK